MFYTNKKNYLKDTTEYVFLEIRNVEHVKKFGNNFFRNAELNHEFNLRVFIQI
jgi:hypothetical protein